MITAARSLALRAPRSYLTFTGGVLVAAIAALVAAGLLIGGSDRGSPRAGQRAADIGAFVAFERSVGELVGEGGSVVVFGMKPGVADIAEGGYPDDTLRHMAGGWLESFETLEAELAELRVPPFAAGAAAQLEAAFAAYSRTAALLLEAARADGAARAALVDAAAAAGTRADDLYDQALAALDAHRTRLGLPPKKEGS
jgi:hypothetical protein